MVRLLTTTCVLLLLLLVGAAAYAQKVTSGVVDFVITYPNPSKEIKENLEALPQKMTIFFKDSQVRIEMQTIMGSVVILSNSASQKSYVLTEMMGKKIAMVSTAGNTSRIEGENDDRNNTKYEITKVKKNIAGYKCRQVKVTTTIEGKSYAYFCYFTEELPDISLTLNGENENSIKGFMLKYDMINNGIHMNMEATRITPKELDLSLFVVPAGYEMVTEGSGF